MCVCVCVCLGPETNVLRKPDFTRQTRCCNVFAGKTNMSPPSGHLEGQPLWDEVRSSKFLENTFMHQSMLVKGSADRRHGSMYEMSPTGSKIYTPSHADDRPTNSTNIVPACWWSFSAEHRHGLVYKLLLPKGSDIYTPSRGR